MQISSRYVLVEKYIPPAKDEAFTAVEPQDDYIWKGVIHTLPGEPVHVSNHQLSIGDVVAFAKYSPDTHEIELDGKSLKFVRRDDLLAVL